MASLALFLRKPHMIFRRSPTRETRNQEGKEESSGPQTPELCDFDQIPKWYQDNPHILTHYRPVSESYHACIHGLTYLHNESLNMYTHLIPAVALTLALPTLQIRISSIYAHAPWMDRFMLTLTPMAALGTFTLSTSYHTFINHSPFVSASCLLLDYTGILILILASFFSGIYVGFYDSVFHQRLYWGMIVSLVATSCLLILHPRLQGPLYRSQRTAAFILTALSGFAPVVHGCVYHGFYEAFWHKGVMWWLAEGFWYGVGAALFATRFPESAAWAKQRVVGPDGKARWKGRFDVFGTSHQYFHVCVVLGAICHCWGVWDAWRKAI